MTVVEGGAQDAGLLADVLVAPVAGAADDHRAPLGRHVAHACHQGGDGVGVVAVVGDHGGAAVVEHVEAAGHALLVADEAGQAFRMASQGRPTAQAAPTEAMTFST
jgi:hypothetical protein